MEEAKHLPPAWNIDAAKVPYILGSAAECVVFTGEITYVGDRHVEYNMNSFGSCSGAAVFLLDKDKPDYGKVLAVHVGHKPQLNANVGFKLARVFEYLG